MPQPAFGVQAFRLFLEMDDSSALLGRNASSDSCTENLIKKPLGLRSCLLVFRTLEYIASPKVQLIRERSFFYMSKSVPITVAHGDGIGPEIMAATLWCGNRGLEKNFGASQGIPGTGFDP